MSKYQQSHPDAEDALGLIDAVHADADLRLQLGTHFLNRLAHLPRTSVPNRLRSANEQKAPLHSYLAETGTKMSSREYTSLLAIRMIDGSYDNSDDARGSDGIVFKPDGTIELGQHRYTAKLLLGIEPHPPQAQAA